MPKDWDTPFDRLFKEFEKQYPVDFVFDRAMSQRSATMLLEIYRYREQVRQNDLLEKLLTAIRNKK